MFVTIGHNQLLENVYMSEESQDLPKIPRCPVSGVLGFGWVKVLSVYSLYVTFLYVPPSLPLLVPKKTSEALWKALWENKGECLQRQSGFFLGSKWGNKTRRNDFVINSHKQAHCKFSTRFYSKHGTVHRNEQQADDQTSYIYRKLNENTRFGNKRAKLPTLATEQWLNKVTHEKTHTSTHLSASVRDAFLVKSFPEGA